MLCENCGERGAEIHIVRIINGMRVEEGICRKCAEKAMSFNGAKVLKMSLSLEGIKHVEKALKNLLFPILPDLNETADKDIKCPHCGKELDLDELLGQLGDNQQGGDIVFDFSRAGSDAGFAGWVPEVKSEEQVHSSVPDIQPVRQPVSSEKELNGLKRELEFVLRGEKYERAAEIRDRIIELEKIINESKGA